MIIAKHYALLARSGLILLLPAILWLALMPVDLTYQPDWNDKIQHILAFTTITLLVDAAWPKQPFNRQKVLAVMAYGSLIEILQGFTEDRSASLADLVADSGGILIYWLFIPILQKIPIVNLRWRPESLPR